MPALSGFPALQATLVAMTPRRARRSSARATSTSVPRGMRNCAASTQFHFIHSVRWSRKGLEKVCATRAARRGLEAARACTAHVPDPAQVSADLRRADRSDVQLRVARPDTRARTAAGSRQSSRQLTPSLRHPAFPLVPLSRPWPRRRGGRGRERRSRQRYVPRPANCLLDVPMQKSR